MQNALLRSTTLLYMLFSFIAWGPCYSSDSGNFLDTVLYDLTSYKGQSDENGKRKRKEVTFSPEHRKAPHNSDNEDSVEADTPAAFSDDELAEEELPVVPQRMTGHKRGAAKLSDADRAVKLATNDMRTTPFYVEAGLLFQAKTKKQVFKDLVTFHITPKAQGEVTLEHIQKQYDDGFIRSPEEYCDLLVSLASVEPENFKPFFRALATIISAREKYVPCSYQIFMKNLKVVPLARLADISSVIAEFIKISDFNHLHLLSASLIDYLLNQREEWISILPKHIRTIKTWPEFKTFMEETNVANPGLPFVWLRRVICGEFTDYIDGNHNAADSRPLNQEHANIDLLLTQFNEMNMTHSPRKTASPALHPKEPWCTHFSRGSKDLTE